MNSKKTKTHTKGHVYKNQSACASGEGVSAETVKYLISVGAPVKRNGAIDRDEFRAWLSANPQKVPKTPAGQKLSLREQKTTEEIRKLKIRNDKEDGKTVDAIKESEWLLRQVKESAGILYQKLVNEATAAMPGMEVVQARTYAKRLYNLTMGPLRALIKKPEHVALLQKHESDVSV